MSIAAYSVVSEECKKLKNGKYSLFFKDNLLCISDGTKVIAMDLNTFALYDPTTSTALLPYINNNKLEYKSTTVKASLANIINQLIALYSEYYKYKDQITISDDRVSFFFFKSTQIHSNFECYRSKSNSKIKIFPKNFKFWK